MRNLLLAGFAALALSLPGFDASAATIGEFARSSNIQSVALAQPTLEVNRFEPLYVRDSARVATGRGDRSEASVADTIGTVVALAGAGLILTMGAVGLRRVWTQDPIPDPLRDGPVYL